MAAKLLASPARAVNALIPQAAKRGLRAVGSNGIDKLVTRGTAKVLEKAGEGPPGRALHLVHRAWMGSRAGKSTSAIAEGATRWFERNFIPRRLWGREYAGFVREMENAQAFGAQQALDITRSLKGTEKLFDIGYPPRYRRDKAMKERLWDVLDGQANIGTLPADMQRVARKLRQVLDAVGLEAVRQGREMPRKVEAMLAAMEAPQASPHETPNQRRQRHASTAITAGKAVIIRGICTEIIGTPMLAMESITSLNAWALIRHALSRKRTRN